VDGERARLDELHGRPALQIAFAEALEQRRSVGDHPDGVDHVRHEHADRVGVRETLAIAVVQVDRGHHAPGRECGRRPGGSGGE
jgi:hypothetical protein